jgi:uncharacterized protein (TIGR02284 family)
MVTENKCRVLGDLFRINKDCTHSYQRIMENSPTMPMVGTLLQRLVNTERNLLLELRSQVDISFGDPADAVEVHGDIYKTWQRGIDGGIPSREREILTFCERKMKALTQAYDSALQCSHEFPEQVKKMLGDHLKRIRDCFTSIKGYYSTSVILNRYRLEPNY